MFLSVFERVCGVCVCICVHTCACTSLTRRSWCSCSPAPRRGCSSCAETCRSYHSRLTRTGPPSATTRHLRQQPFTGLWEPFFVFVSLGRARRSRDGLMELRMSRRCRGMLSLFPGISLVRGTDEPMIFLCHLQPLLTPWFVGGHLTQETFSTQGVFSRKTQPVRGGGGPTQRQLTIVSTAGLRRVVTGSFG